MKKSLNLLLALSTISLQLWAAEPARPSATFAAAAAAASPAGSESKISTENHDYSRMLAKLKEIAATETFRMLPSEWRNPEKLRIKTNCKDIAEQLIRVITGKRLSDIQREESRFNSPIFCGTMEQLVSKSTTEYENKLAQELFNPSIKKEYKLFYGISRPENRKPDQAYKFHVFLILKIGSSTQTDYIILNTWHNAFDLAQWLDATKLTLPYWPFTKEEGLKHIATHTKYNPSNKVTVADIIEFLNNIFPGEPPYHSFCVLDISATPFITDILATQTPSTPAAASAASAASPSPVDQSTTCSHSGCRNLGTKICGRCQIKYYCSPECQKKDWRTHKPLCLPAPAKKS